MEEADCCCGIVWCWVCGEGGRADESDALVELGDRALAPAEPPALLAEEEARWRRLSPVRALSSSSSFSSSWFALPGATALAPMDRPPGRLLEADPGVGGPTELPIGGGGPLDRPIGGPTGIVDGNWP